MSNVRGFQFGQFTPITPTDLPKGVTRSSLMEMRSTGMSNKGIADALGIAPWKVSKTIGETPKEIRDQIRAKLLVKAREAKASKRAAGKKQGAVKVKGSLVKVCELFTLQGKVASYTVDTAEKTVEIKANQGDIAAMTIKFEDCEAFALELMDVIGEIGT